VVCTTGGALGAAQFTYSLDGGNTVKGPLLVPASGKYAPADTGLLLTFANALVATDAWSCSTTSAGFTTTDLTNAMNAALADPRTWGIVHVVGAASTVSGAAAVAAALDGLLTTAEKTLFRYARGIVEFPSDTDGNTLNAVASTVSARVCPCAGFAYVRSQLNGSQWYASAAWPFAARLNAIPLSEDPGRVLTGGLTNTALSGANTTLPKGRDEAATPGLDAGRFTTLRTLTGRAGVFVTAGRTLANPGSDYSLIQMGRVMDVACAATRDVLLDQLNATVRVDPDTGQILEKDAQAIENEVGARLAAVLVNPGDASAASVVVNRTANILSSQTLYVSVRVVPLGYARAISTDIGFQNPAIK
jgi:hypothetical protein